MKAHQNQNELDTLLMLLAQGEISAEQLKKLQTSMAEHPETLEYAMDFLMVSAGLESVCREDDAEAAKRLQEILSTRTVTSRGTKIPRRFMLTVMRVAAAVLVFCGITVGFVKLMQATRDTGLARIVNGLSMRWSDEGAGLQSGTRLEKGPRYLMEGTVEIKMASGARIVIQGPSRFSIETRNEIYLTTGAVAAQVPNKARGFSVLTKHASVVDYGTDFGVIAKSDDTIEVHVFAGQVVIEPDAAAAQSVKGGRAAVVDQRGRITGTGRRAEPSRFVRALPDAQTRACPGKWLDLSDIVGGGNGFGTGTLGCGINPSSGDSLPSPVLERLRDDYEAFIMLMNWRYVDGVFVPNGALDRLTISSSEFVFSQCPVTDGTYYGGIFKGAGYAVRGGQASYIGRMNGDLYGIPAAPALTMPGNAGITFDLDRIRADNADVTISSLSAVCGFVQTGPGSPMIDTEFWVLIDGVVCFHCEGTSIDSKAVPVAVPIESGDRFLTLATTTGRGAAGCWAAFGSPLLELQAMQQ